MNFYYQICQIVFLRAKGHQNELLRIALTTRLTSDGKGVCFCSFGLNDKTYKHVKGSSIYDVLMERGRRVQKNDSMLWTAVDVSRWVDGLWDDVTRIFSWLISIVKYYASFEFQYYSSRQSLCYIVLHGIQFLLFFHHLILMSAISYENCERSTLSPDEV